MVDCHIKFEFMRVLVYEFLSWGGYEVMSFLGGEFMSFLVYKLGSWGVYEGLNL